MVHLFNKILEFFKIFILYRDGSAIGDQVCMSAIIKLINEQYHFKVVIFSNFPEFFINNPRVLLSINIDNNRLLFKIVRKLSGSQIENFLFKNEVLEFEEYMRDTKAKIHLIEAHSMHFINKIKYTDFRCEIFFSKREIEEFKNKFNFPENFALIQPIGKTTYTPNKEWGFDNYQKVVEKTKSQITWVQIGFKNDKLLDAVIDIRGDTETLRELAYAISQASFILSNEGLLNHIASAFNTHSFVVFSGFSQTNLAKYKTTTTIANTPQVECSPCWLRGDCPKPKKYCTEMVMISDVVEKLHQQL